MGVRRALRLLLVALTLMAAAVSAGSAPAGWDEGRAAFERGDFEAARKAWLPLAEAGDARAQAALGSLYLDGLGVPADYGTALRWTRRAALGGDATGQFNMGNIHAQGLGVPRDYAKAAEWFARGADQDDAASRFNLGVLYARGLGVARDDVEALFLINTAIVIAGDPDAGLGHVADAAERYSYVVMATMTKLQIEEAFARAHTWERAFLPRYLKRRFRRDGPAE